MIVIILGRVEQLVKLKLVFAMPMKMIDVINVRFLGTARIPVLYGVVVMLMIGVVITVHKYNTVSLINELLLSSIRYKCAVQVRVFVRQHSYL